MESSCRTIMYMGEMDIYKIHVGCPTRVLVKWGKTHMGLIPNAFQNLKEA